MRRWVSAGVLNVDDLLELVLLLDDCSFRILKFLILSPFLSPPPRCLARTCYSMIGPVITGGIPDDLYHCRDPEQVGTDSIGCNPETQEWQVQEFSPDAPPAMCGPDFTISAEEVANIQDWFEPCVLWAMTYGNLRPMTSPTAAPTLAAAPTNGMSIVERTKGIQRCGKC